MTITVKKNWWKTLFDDLYLQTDARSVCDETLTRREVDFLIQKLDLNRSDFLLDLCGGHGRHALELSRRGFQRVVLLDYSKCLLQYGLHAARRNRLSTAFIQSDARCLGFAAHAFKTVLMMGCSFGYFSDDNENSRILNSVYRTLLPSGQLLLDLPHREYVIQHFTPRIRHQVDGLEIIRTRELRNDTIYAREEVISPAKGALRVNHYCTRLYDPDTITDLLVTNGFGDIRFEPGFMDRSAKDNYGTMTSRMVVMAVKP